MDQFQDSFGGGTEFPALDGEFFGPVFGGSDLVGVVEVSYTLGLGAEEGGGGGVAYEVWEENSDDCC